MEFIPFEGERRIFDPLPASDIYPDKGPLNNFVDAALGLAANGSGGRLGLASMEVIEAACASARTNRPTIIR
jgi:hypothetical protein